MIAVTQNSSIDASSVDKLFNWYCPPKKYLVLIQVRELHYEYRTVPVCCSSARIATLFRSGGFKLDTYQIILLAVILQ